MIFKQSYQFGETALMKASEDGHLDVVQVLLAEGADINATNKASYMI
jgi:ankyrin repeat protein